MKKRDFSFIDAVRLTDFFAVEIFGERLFDFEGRGGIQSDADTLADMILYGARGLFDGRADELSGVLADSAKRLRNILLDDARSIYEKDPAANSIDEVIHAYPGFYAIFCYRIAHILYGLGLPMLPRLVSEYAHSLTGADIHPGANIGERFSIDHGTGIVIGETSDIGDDVAIYQGVTIGAKIIPRNTDLAKRRKEKRHPTVKDGCRIYTNAMILGKDTVIGENSVIGAGVIVTHSVSANTVIAANGF